MRSPGAIKSGKWIERSTAEIDAGPANTLKDRNGRVMAGGKQKLKHESFVRVGLLRATSLKNTI
jgi:hypothetical protein